MAWSSASRRVIDLWPFLATLREELRLLINDARRDCEGTGVAGSSAMSWVSSKTPASTGDETKKDVLSGREMKNAGLSARECKLTGLASAGLCSTSPSTLVIDDRLLELDE